MVRPNCDASTGVSGSGVETNIHNNLPLLPYEEQQQQQLAEDDEFQIGECNMIHPPWYFLLVHRFQL